MGSDKKVPKTFLSKAFLTEEENGVYRLYRSMIVEDDAGRQEKVGRPIPFGKYLREAAKGEETRVVVKSYHPKSQRELHLVEIE